ncbi:hypothetical protein GCM10027035_10870 [Emticicia sediminis]
MKPISDLTYKIVAISDLPQSNINECIDWAIEMLILGYETPSLLILAGLSKPVNFFELNDYLQTTLKELNIQSKNGDEAILSYCSFYIKKISDGIDIEENLKEVYVFCLNNDYEDLVFDFYLLYWALDDIKHGEEFTHYWNDANRYNIRNIIIDTAKTWIETNKGRYLIN